MKAITIKQPYASLITLGLKDIENRIWKTNFRGRIYIHSSQKAIPMNGNDDGFKPSMEQLKEIFKLCTVKDGRWPDILSQYPNSAIVGEVDIIDCIQNSNSIWSLPGYWHWVLANPLFYDKPILNISGKQSFWDYNQLNHL